MRQLMLNILQAEYRHQPPFFTWFQSLNSVDYFQTYRK